MRLIYTTKHAFTGAVDIMTSKERIQELLGIPFYRNSIYLMLNSIILAATGFLFWMIASRLYSAESVGLASAAISAVGLLALLSTFGLDYGIIRFLPKSGAKANDVINSCLTTVSLISLLLSLIFLAGLNLWSPALLVLRENPIFFAAFVIFTIATTLMTLVRQTFIAKRRAKFALAQELVFGLLRVIPLIVLATFFQTFGIFVSWGIALGVAVAAGIILFIPRVQAGYHPLPTISKVVIKNMRHFSLANYGVILFGATPGFIFPIMVANLSGAESNAYFYIAWIIGGLLFMIPRAASLSLFAEGSYDKQHVRRDMKRSIKLILIFLIPAMTIIFLAGDKILLLFGKAYSESATRLLWILAFSALPASMIYIYVGVKRVRGEMKAPLVLAALIIVISLGLGYYLLPRVGIIGIGIAWLTSLMVAALFLGYDFYRTYTQR